MAGSASISGLASGLDTATIIDQLMQLEAIPQSRLQDRVSSQQRAVNALQTLNAKVAALATRAADLLQPDAWSPLATTSSNDKVTVTTGAGADPTGFTLTVDQTARSHRLEFATATGLTTAGAVPTTVRLDRLDGTTLDLTTDGTLQGLVDAVNDPANETGLHATAVRVGTDQYRLLVESTETGAATDFTLTATDGSPLLGGATVRAGQDARITLGSSIVATSTSNTFTDLLPGVTVTLASDATGTSDVVISQDTAAMVETVQGFVDTVNGLLTEIDNLTSSGGSGKAKGLLAGDAGLRSLRGQLLDTVFPSDGTSLAGVGIQTDRYGKLVFDDEAFTEAYAADPAGVAARFTTAETGFLARVEQVAVLASDKYEGTLTSAITGRNKAIERLNDNITAWDTRLELRRTTLTRQFTALEVALSRMNSQSSWLAGQINSLPTMNSGS